MLKEIGDRVLSGERIGEEDALFLLENASPLYLGRLAHGVRERLNPRPEVTFVIDRNINYTNVCINKCKFCAFWREPGDPEAFVLTHQEVFKKIEELVALGGTAILIQGGLNPDIGLDYIVGLFRAVKERFPQVHIHGLSPPEIWYYAEKEGLTVAEVIERLVDAGLGSIPGGGAEVLSDRVRQQISPNKLSSERWLEVMETAHSLGLKSSATMMFGSVDTWEDVVEHLSQIRAVQDRTGGFTAFIPWSFQPPNTRLQHLPSKTGVDYLKVLAVSRIFLDNVQHIQASWVTQGIKMGQVALFFGADDLGSTMIEENVVAAAGATYRTSVEEMVRVIKDAGFTPVQRTTLYQVLRRF
jgi:cyclic dehypoxanthinyl futalosine synthase